MREISKEEFEKHFANAKFQLEIEGHVVTKEDEEDVRKVIMGEMTREELIEQLKKGN